MIDRRAFLPLAVLALAACGPQPASPDAGRTHHPTPTPNPTTPAPAPGALHVVHTPQIIVDDMHLHAGECQARTAANGQPLPDPVCTPGAIDPAVTQANIQSTICVQGYTATVRPPQTLTAPAKRASMTEYGLTTSGEFDHLVALELGGASSTSNLWVEVGPIPNVKDNVENTLRAEVCSGKLTLAAAQQEIARDWTTAK